MTFLSVKALRHYHEVGLLPPAEIDSDTGYRRYQVEQVPVAQVIRRLRELGMSLDDVRAVIEAHPAGGRPGQELAKSVTALKEQHGLLIVPSGASLSSNRVGHTAVTRVRWSLARPWSGHGCLGSRGHRTHMSDAADW
jgi:DNA-binding transcriptional MerR regulator